MLMKLRSLLRNKKGQSLVEYGILTGGIALVCLAATAILGHKTNDLIATVAASLPGAHAEDNGPIVSGKLVATTENTTLGGLTLDAASPGSIESNLGIVGVAALVIEAD
jgi:pilus assembly protein Flp/PilA